MEQKKIVRDQSTPDRREIWEFVERAASRAGSLRHGDVDARNTPSCSHSTDTPRVHAVGSVREQE
jgi:hypothetical protein